MQAIVASYRPSDMKINKSMIKLGFPASPPGEGKETAFVAEWSMQMSLLIGLFVEAHGPK